MAIDPKLLIEAKLDIQKLKDLSAISFPDEVRAEADEYPVTLGFKLSKAQDIWILRHAKRFTKGKKSVFFRTLLDILIESDKTKKEKE